MTPDEMREARLNRGFSIRGLAKHLGVPEQSIRRAEGGEGVSPGNAYKLATFYGQKVTDIWPVEVEQEVTAA